MGHLYILPQVSPHPCDLDKLNESFGVEPKTLEIIREKNKGYKDAKWACSRCVGMGSPNLGHLVFAPVGPDRSMPTVTTDRFYHWSYYFIGWLNLETGNIQKELP